MASNRFSLNPGAEVIQWMEGLTKDTGYSKAELYKRLFKDAKNSGWIPGGVIDSEIPTEPGAPLPINGTTGKVMDKSDHSFESFIAHVRVWYTPELAADHMELPNKQLGKWRKNEHKASEISRTMMLYAFDRERDLVLVGTGKKAGNATALRTWLEFNHPEFQGGDSGMVDKVLAPVVEEIVNSFQDTVGRADDGKKCLECQREKDSLVKILNESLERVFKGYRDKTEVFG